MHLATPASALRKPRVLFGFGIGLGLAAASTFGASSPSNEPPIELPKFVVTDSRDLPPPESWRYATIPGFEILTNASDRATQRLIEDFQLFRDVLGVVWPVPSQRNPPVLLILSGKGGKFDAFVPPKTEGSPETAKASLFLRGKTHTAIVIDLESAVVNVQALEEVDPSTGVDSSQFMVDHNKQLYREYVRYLLSQSEPRFPPWFEEGMAQIIMAMKFDRKHIEFGKLEDPNEVSPQAAAAAALNASNAAEASGGDSSDPSTGNTFPIASAPAEDRDFNAALARRALLPMGKLFAVGYNDPEAQNPLGANAWAKQCYAFVHMGLYGENGKWQKPFSQFLMRATREPVTEAMFKDCFHMSYGDMGIQLRGYIQYAVYKSQEYNAKGDGFPKPPPLDLKEATESQVGRIKGEAFILGGHPDLARAAFIAPYIRGERDPELLAELGLAEHADGKDDRARKFLTAAADGDAHDPDAFRQLAQMRFADAMAASPAPNHPFSAAQTTAITTLLAKARRLPPPSMETYDLLAATWAQSVAKPQPADIGMLIEGVRLYPGHMKLVYSTAALCADSGMFEAAHSLVEHGLKFAPDAATKSSFEKLNAMLPPEKKAPAATPAAAGASAAPSAK